MKKIRMILSALIVFAVVGSALAFNTKGAANVLTCNTITSKCVLTIYSTSGTVNPITPPEEFVKNGTAGVFCDDKFDCGAEITESQIFENP